MGIAHAGGGDEKKKGEDRSVQLGSKGKLSPNFWKIAVNISEKDHSKCDVRTFFGSRDDAPKWLDRDIAVRGRTSKNPKMLWRSYMEAPKRSHLLSSHTMLSFSATTSFALSLPTSRESFVFHYSESVCSCRPLLNLLLLDPSKRGTGVSYIFVWRYPILK